MNQPGSFIPRQSPVSPSRRPKRNRIYIFSYITYVVFFATLLTVAGLFLWGLQLSSSLDAQKQRLVQQRDLFKPADIETVRDFNSRITLVTQLIDSHPAFSRVLGALSETTLQNIKISSLTAVASDSNSSDYQVVLSGKAPNFGALLFQRSTLEANSIFADSEVTTITYDVSDEISSLSQTIDYQITAVIPVTRFAYDGLAIQNEVPFIEQNTTDEVFSNETETTANTGSASVSNEDLSEVTNEDSF